MKESKAMSEDMSMSKHVGLKTGFEAVFVSQTRGLLETAVMHSVNEKLSFADYLTHTIYEVTFLCSSQSNLSSFFFIVKSVLIK